MGTVGEVLMRLEPLDLELRNVVFESWHEAGHLTNLQFAQYS